VNLPLHHWTYEAIERLVALRVIDRAMVVPKPYSRKEAARYVARAIELARRDRVPRDGREVIAEPLLYPLTPPLSRLACSVLSPGSRRSLSRPASLAPSARNAIDAPTQSTL